MKYPGLFAIAFFCTLQTFGQQDYFMYLQTGDNQAFYVRFRDKVYSSTGSGYLILSKLPDSTTQLTIGFPKNIFPEQRFDVPVDHRDAGYLLKNFGDKGWGLFNLQTAAVIMSSSPPEEKKSPDLTITRRTDAFSLLLANAVNDSAVLYVQTKPVKPVESAPKKDSIAPAVVAKSSDVEKKQEEKDTAIVVKTVAAPPKKDSAIAIVKHPPVKKDSAISAAKKPSLAKDSSLTAARGKPFVRNSKQAGKDTTAALVHTRAPKTDSSKAVAVTKKPSGLFSRAPKERKDTIIMMSGGKPVAAKSVEKPSADKKQAPDSFYAVKPKSVAKSDSAIALRKPKPVAAKQADSSKAIAKQEAKEQEPAAKETVMAPINKAPGNTDTAIAASTRVPDTVVQKTPAITEAPKRLRPLVNKAAEVFTDTSYVAVFVDESQEKFDTIRLSIPFFEAMKLPAAATGIASQKMDTVIPARKVIDSLNSPVVTKTDSTKSTLPYAADTSRKLDTTVTTLAPVVAAATKDSVHPQQDSAVARTTPAPAAALVNPNCKEIASDNEIDKLRVKMLLMSNEEEKTGLAKKLFQQRCVLTRQVRALSELFKTDEAKYKWFDAAYPYVSDLSNFPALSELIKDSYYLNRFKAMLRN
jgi:hypothetical protein